MFKNCTDFIVENINNALLIFSAFLSGRIIRTAGQFAFRGRGSLFFVEIWPENTPQIARSPTLGMYLPAAFCGTLCVLGNWPDENTPCSAPTLNTGGQLKRRDRNGPIFSCTFLSESRIQWDCSLEIEIGWAPEKGELDLAFIPKHAPWNSYCDGESYSLQIFV